MSFVMLMSPFSMGHSMSTFLTCSQRSALVEIRRIRPYLTWRLQYAPSPMTWFAVPVAFIVSDLPLLHGQRKPPRAVRLDDRNGRATYANGGLGVRSTFVMVRISELWSLGHSSSGESPGILRSSSSVAWVPPKTLRAVAEATPSTAREMAESLIADVRIREALWERIRMLGC